MLYNVDSGVVLVVVGNVSMIVDEDDDAEHAGVHSYNLKFKICLLFQ